MAILEVLTYPNPLLQVTAKPISEIDQELRNFAQNMIETMYEYDGVGLAATQVGANKRLIVIDVKYKKDNPNSKNPIVMINPVIVEAKGESRMEEGCLSVPDYRSEVSRYANVTLEYENLKGEKIRQSADELFAIAIQHEIDHLNGTLFIDRLPTLKRNMVRKKLKKLAQHV